MTARTINLRTHRRRKERAEARKQADARAAEHGLPKTARSLERDRSRLENARLEGKRLTTDEHE